MLEPLDETYWGEWELYEVCGGFEHVEEGEWERFEEMMAETNVYGKQRMREIHREVSKAKIRLARGQAHTRAGSDIEAGQRVGYLACDVYGESGHPCGCLRYRNRLGRIGNIFITAQFEASPCVGYDNRGYVSNLWFAATAHVAPNVARHWEPVDEKKRELLWMLVGRAARRITKGEVLSVDPNDSAGNHTSCGEGRSLPHPTGPQALRLRHLALPGVRGCKCHAECTAIVLDDDDDISDSEWCAAKATARTMGVRLIGKRAGDSDNEDTAQGPAKVLKRSVCRGERSSSHSAGAPAVDNVKDERSPAGVEGVAKSSVRAWRSC